MSEVRLGVTLFTDASVCPETNAGGWAFWAKGDNRGSLEESGYFRREITDSNEGELLSIANALYRLNAVKYFRPEDVWVVLQSDNIDALNMLRKELGAFGAAKKHERDIELDARPAPPVRDKHREAIALINGILLENKLKLYVRHVRAHTGKDSTRHGVNDRCDLLAKQAMQQRREEIKRERKSGTGGAVRVR